MSPVHDIVRIQALAIVSEEFFIKIQPECACTERKIDRRDFRGQGLRQMRNFEI